MMMIHLEFWSLILIFGMLQGIFLSAALILFKKENKKANTILGILLLVFSSMLLEFSLTKNEVMFFDPYGRLLYLNSSTAFLIGPLFYFYIKSMLKEQIRFVEIVFHFSLAALCFVNFLPTYVEITQAVVNSELSFTVSAPIINFNGFLYMGLMIAQSFFYVFFANKFLKIKYPEIKLENSHPNLIYLDWLTRFSNVFALIILVLALLFLYMVFVTYYEAMELLIALSLSYFVFFVAVYSLKQPQIYVEQIEKVSKPKYEHSGLSGLESTKYKKCLIEFMEKEKPYLNENLKLPELAGEIGLTPNNLSQLLNQELKTNFFDFVNSYRIKEAQEKLVNPEFANYTILAVAMESGFSNKTSFNRIFKKLTGTTPSAYLSQNQTKLAV